MKHPRISTMIAALAGWGMRQGLLLAAVPPALRKLLLAFAFVTVAVLAIRSWGWILCWWGPLQSCMEWALQAGYQQRAGFPPVRQIPILPLTLVGPVGYILATTIWRYNRRSAKGGMIAV